MSNGNWGLDGQLENYSNKTVIVLISGKYYKLPPHSYNCSDGANKCDVDGFWWNGKFYGLSDHEEAEIHTSGTVQDAWTSTPWDRGYRPSAPTPTNTDPGAGTGLPLMTGSTCKHI